MSLNRESQGRFMQREGEEGHKRRGREQTKREQCEKKARGESKKKKIQLNDTPLNLILE